MLINSPWTIFLTRQSSKLFRIISEAKCKLWKMVLRPSPSSPQSPLLTMLAEIGRHTLKPEIPFCNTALTVLVSRHSIRSTIGHSCYWHYSSGISEADGPIRVTDSYNSRSLFKIWAPDTQEGAIMIDDDNISIIIQHHGFLTLLPVDEKNVFMLWT